MECFSPWEWSKFRRIEELSAPPISVKWFLVWDAGQPDGLTLRNTRRYADDGFGELAPASGVGDESGCGSFLSLSAHQVVIERAVRVLATYVIFSCTFKGRPVYYELHVREPKHTEKVADILRANIGMTLKAVEGMEIDNRTDQEMAS